ncbi:hypothetical protein K440DRAFT_627605 [Wilcoxina mikolae CBS 423.85]|nr:hypothetical protein K440DRAFT_627605 [Wilcoxina mikolae CBS 423.85]
MADSYTSRYVQSPLVRSVVTSTTGVNAIQFDDTPAVAGSSNCNSVLSPSENSASTHATVAIRNGDSKPESTENNASELERMGEGFAVHRMSENIRTRRCAEIRNDVETLGNESPTKLDRKTCTKKPSFKPVSLNKQFLKEQLTSTTAPASTGSTLQPKGNALGTNVSQFGYGHTTPSKLRLVRTSGYPQTLRPTGTGSSCSSRSEVQPVWNKNQLPPPPAKKEFTDEELSKKYGIHLASRLGSDDSTNKEAKWADIDDDDDDWVPTTIEWNDKIKVTLNTEGHAPLTEIDSKPVKEPDKNPVKEAARQNVTIAPHAPSIKLSASPVKAKISQSVSGPKALVTLKPSMKSTLSAVSHAPPSSPWGKMPLAIASPSEHRTSRPPNSLETSRQNDTGHVPKAVSAEVYDRSWRDNSCNQNRELFNSHTGKMEPVPDDYRPVRSPISKPAVLQRSTAPSQALGPAEPSAAFQTGRTSHRPDDFRRRRTSSNVSGGSGSMSRRLSLTRHGIDPPTPDDIGFSQNRHICTSTFDENGSPPPAFRQYTGYGSHRTPVDPTHFSEVTPTMASALAMTRPSILRTSGTNPNDIHTELLPHSQSVPLQYNEDVVVKQERIMREARELARKRRHIEEEKLESEKRERLRSKLEALEKLAKETEQIDVTARRAEEVQNTAERCISAGRLPQVEKRWVAGEKAKGLVWDLQRENGRGKKREHFEPDPMTAAGVSVSKTRSAVDSTSIAVGHSHEACQASALHDTSRYVRQPNFILSTSSSSPLSPIHPGCSSPNAISGSHLSSEEITFATSSSASIMYDRSSAVTHISGIHSNDCSNNNPNQAWKCGSNLRANNDQWDSNTGSPWGAVGDGSRPTGSSRPGPGGHNNNGHHLVNSNNRSGSATSGDGRYYCINRERRNNRNSPPPLSGPSPIGAYISEEDRAKAVNQWNSLPSKILADEEATYENKRRTQLVREAEEAATGLKQAVPVQQYHIVESFKKFEIEHDGSRTQRCFKGKLTKGIDEAQSSSLSVSIPKSLAASKPSRFFPEDADNLIIKPHSEHKGQSPVALANSPPPPISADHPVHGSIMTTRVHLPFSIGLVMPVTDDSYLATHAPDFKRFEEVQQRILGRLPGNSLPVCPSIFPTSIVSPRSKPSFETLSDTFIDTPTVSLPSHAVESAGYDSMLTIPDSEQFFIEFFKQDFGSTPTVKIPRVAHSYNAVSKSHASDITGARSSSAKKNLKNHKGLVQSSDIFNAFGVKDFSSREGLRFYPVHVPGGKYMEVPLRAQEKTGRVKHISQKKKTSVRRNEDVRNDYRNVENRSGHHRNEDIRIRGNDLAYNFANQAGGVLEC